MLTPIFVGWPLQEAQHELMRRCISLEKIITVSTPVKNELVGSPYVIQERWNGNESVTLVAGLRLSMKGAAK